MYFNFYGCIHVGLFAELCITLMIKNVVYKWVILLLFFVCSKFTDTGFCRTLSMQGVWNYKNELLITPLYFIACFLARVVCVSGGGGGSRWRGHVFVTSFRVGYSIILFNLEECITVHSIVSPIRVLIDIDVYLSLDASSGSGDRSTIVDGCVITIIPRNHRASNV